MQSTGTQTKCGYISPIYPLETFCVDFRFGSLKSPPPPHRLKSNLLKEKFGRLQLHTRRLPSGSLLSLTYGFSLPFTQFNELAWEILN